MMAGLTTMVMNVCMRMVLSLCVKLVKRANRARMRMPLTMKIVLMESTNDAMASTNLESPPVSFDCCFADSMRMMMKAPMARMHKIRNCATRRRNMVEIALRLGKAWVRYGMFSCRMSSGCETAYARSLVHLSGGPCRQPKPQQLRQYTSEA